jgi:hypothetical protein
VLKKVLRGAYGRLRGRSCSAATGSSSVDVR